jgi:DNA polymerase-3 subunit delta'
MPEPSPVFAELTGQEIVVDQLQRAVAGARTEGHRRTVATVTDEDGAAGPGTALAAGVAAGAAGRSMTHAWLFTGPPGSGRSLAARAFAAALLCDQQGCGECRSCRQVAGGTHADVLLVRPDGLSYGVRQTRELVLKAAAAPVYGRWRIVLFEDADRSTEQAANALLKAIEEPAPRTVWLLCAPYADDLPTTIRSRCRLVTLVTPRTSAVIEVLQREGVPAERARTAALAAQGHIGRARRLATDEQAVRRRAEALRVAGQVNGLGQALKAAAALVKAAEAESTAATEELDEPERDALRRAFGEGSTGKGVATALRGGAGALRDLEDRQKSRATRLKRDALDRALLDLAGYYRDVLALQLGAAVELANEPRDDELRQLAGASGPADTVRRIEAIMRCRQRLELNAAPLLAVEELTLALAGQS